MRSMRTKSAFWSLCAVALLLTLPFFCSEAQAWRGGGGFSGGSFRGGGGYATGPRGGAVAQGPRGGRAYRSPYGGAAARGPYGAAAVRGPYGGAAARGPGGATAYRPGYPAGGVTYNRNVNVSTNWRPYYGPRYGAAAAGVAAGLAVGAVVGSLSAAAQPMVVNNQTYYYDGTNYYQPCYQGTDVKYCVVPNPNQ
jgi:hypothetical protein